MLQTVLYFAAHGRREEMTARVELHWLQVEQVDVNLVSVEQKLSVEDQVDGEKAEDGGDKLEKFTECLSKAVGSRHAPAPDQPPRRQLRVGVVAKHGLHCPTLQPRPQERRQEGKQGQGQVYPGDKATQYKQYITVTRSVCQCTQSLVCII